MGPGKVATVHHAQMYMYAGMGECVYLRVCICVCTCTDMCVTVTDSMACTYIAV